jgi:hypothetical protein
VDEAIVRRNQWSQKVLANRATPFGFPSLYQSAIKSMSIDDASRQKLHELADILHNNINDVKLVVSYNKGWLYTNTISTINEINNLPFIHNKSYSEAIINRPRNTVKLKNPKHSHRSYFKLHSLTVNQAEAIINFFTNHLGYVAPSGALKEWINSSDHSHLREHYFVDYTGESWLVMLSLVCPGLIRKTLTIVSA